MKHLVKVLLLAIVRLLQRTLCGIKTAPAARRRLVQCEFKVTHMLPHCAQALAKPHLPCFLRFGAVQPVWHHRPAVYDAFALLQHDFAASAILLQLPGATRRPLQRAASERL